MPLNKDDLNSIRDVVKDIVDFAIENSEKRVEQKFVTKDDLSDSLSQFENRIVNRINREISDFAEIQRELLLKIDNHETRITKIETKTAKI